ncbi:hypothetical protein EGW08_002184 [Elysia chlorotica]|uniref:Uncharacterized protein n=1 Tax=Elysia chlorotica TaxID=188477 RepID=A0A433U8C3_ELYCH|nr:hypothetical protein EGW08_002184 [Elysia chlorotica]
MPYVPPPPPSFRLAWICFILLMAGTLGWALVSVFLRYQEHPFVSVWGFQRESSLQAPGLVICLPARYNKDKLKYARPAYRLLSETEFRNVPMFGRASSELDGYEQFFDAWRKELETITVKKARKEIGFTKAETFWYSRMYVGYQHYDLSHVLQPVFVVDKSCWVVNWSLLDTTKNPEFVSDNSSDHKDSGNVGEENISVKSDSLNDTSSINPMGNQTFEILKNFTAADKEQFNNGESFNNQTSESVTSQQFLSTPSTSQKALEFSEPHAVPTASRDTAQGEEAVGDGQEKAGGEAQEEISQLAPGSGSKILRLSPRDSITFVINLQQYSWLGNIYQAGAELYVYDLANGFWTEHPILLRPGTTSNLFYKTTKYKFLPLPYKSFGGIGAQESQTSGANSGCVDTTSDSFVTKMVSVPRSLYSSDLCILEMSMNRSTIECGCSVDAFYNNLHGTPMCSILKFKECFSKKVDEEFVRQEALLAGGEGAEIPCPQACRMTRYESSMTSASYPTTDQLHYLANMTGFSEDRLKENLLSVTIKPQGPLSVTVEHVPELTLLNILGSVGGWMGLCLGASFLSLTELFEAFALSVWILCTKVVSRLRS